MGRHLVNKPRDPFAAKAMRIRLEKGINQVDISAMLGYKSNEYARIESGFRPMRYQLIPNLCEILGVPANTFDDVIPKPKTKEAEFGEQIFERLEEVRTKVLGLTVPEFCKVLKTNSKNYTNIRIGRHPIARYLHRLIKKNSSRDQRLSYSYLLNGELSQEDKLGDSLNETIKQLQLAKSRILELERQVKMQSEKIKDLEIIKSLATRMYTIV